MSKKLNITPSGIGIVTISNPSKLNAWTRAMRVVLTEELTVLTELPREKCRGIVITGEGDAFCAGQDLDEAITYTPEFADTWVSEFWPFYNLLRRCPKPVVAAVNGVAAGSGFQFALCADYRVAHREATLGQPEIKSGQASVTGSWLVSNSIGIARMRALVLTARLVDGEEAFRLGLVDEVTPVESVLDRAISVADEMSRLPSEAFAQTKIALCELEDESFRRAFSIAIATHSSVYATGDPERAIGEFIARSSRANNSPAVPKRSRA